MAAERERIPFNRPALIGTERELIAEALASGRISGDGPFSRRAQELLGELLDAPGRVLLAPSGTQALEMAALLLGVGPGDEVIGPSFTFPSSLGAFALRGARPRFGDVDPSSLNITPAEIERLLGPRTGAIVVTHYGGAPCRMEEIMGLAGAAGVPVVEDAAHGLFASHGDLPLGTIGRYGTLSFHETKNVTSGGEGGALIMSDADDVRRAEVIREKGTDRAAFFRGEVAAYNWIGTGSNFLLSEPQAACLVAQLLAGERIQRARERAWRRYREGLDEWASQRAVGLPEPGPEGGRPWHLFRILMKDRGSRDALIAHLEARGVRAVFHYMPLHLSPMGRRLAPETASAGSLPVSEDVAAQIVRLPLHYGLGEDEVEAVIEAVRSFDPV